MFKALYITAEGRVLDTGNGAVSHSEGQGFGLFFAVVFDDLATFTRLLDWTTRTLRRPQDALYAWRYVPGAQPAVADPNNATDGCLFIAAALARAARRWGQPQFRMAGEAIARDILRLLIRDVGGRLLLLPGAEWFETNTAVVVNPSYYVFPLLAELAALAPSPVWGRLRQDGLRLINEARFGRWGLPADWVEVTRAYGTMRPAPDRPARFGYDAIRIPLYLAWAGLTPPGLGQALTRYWQAFPGARLPAWMGLDDDRAADYGAPAGQRAVAQLAAIPPGTAAWPRLAASEDYYSASLLLLTVIAATERPRI